MNIPLNASRIEDRVKELRQKARNKIALVLKNDEPEVLRHLKIAREFCDLVVVGKAVHDFEIVETDENLEKRLCELLVNGEVDGIIRGHADYTKTLDELRSQTKTPRFFTPALLKDVHGRSFCVTLCNDFEGHTTADKVEATIMISRWLRDIWQVEPKIVVMTAWHGRQWGIYIECFA